MTNDTEVQTPELAWLHYMSAGESDLLARTDEDGEIHWFKVTVEKVEPGKGEN